MPFEPALPPRRSPPPRRLRRPQPLRRNAIRTAVEVDGIRVPLVTSERDGSAQSPEFRPVLASLTRHRAAITGIQGRLAGNEAVMNLGETARVVTQRRRKDHSRFFVLQHDDNGQEFWIEIEINPWRSTVLQFLVRAGSEGLTTLELANCGRRSDVARRSTELRSLGLSIVCVYVESTAEPTGRRTRVFRFILGSLVQEVLDPADLRPVLSIRDILRAGAADGPTRAALRKHSKAAYKRSAAIATFALDRWATAGGAAQGGRS